MLFYLRQKKIVEARCAIPQYKSNYNESLLTPLCKLYIILINFRTMQDA
jgi:hypothetical protein